MSTQAAEVSARQRLWPWHLVSRGAAWVLVACSLVLLGTIFFAGERVTSAEDLQEALNDGDVDVIQVEGSLRYGTVHWSDGQLRRVTEAGEGPRLRVPESVIVSRGSTTTSYGEVGEWRVPGLAGSLGLCVSIGALALLIAGPQPWRATRWAWFWLFWPAPPLGVLAFLLLGGSTLRRPPARPARRLTGGWAFLLVAVAGFAWQVLADAVL